MMGKQVSRRVFLRGAGVVGAGLLAYPLRRGRAQGWGSSGGVAGSGSGTHWDGSPLGRILMNTMTVYAEPTWRSGHVDYLHYNDIVTVLGAVSGEGLYSTNDTWLHIAQGYLYSSWVQPVSDFAGNPTASIGEDGAWGTVTVPITWTRSTPSDEAATRQRMYYSGVHRIIGVENGYYLISEGYGGAYWIEAAHVRIVPPSLFAPLSSHVPPEEKRIEISIGEQVLRAYEGERQVFSAQVSTGVPGSPTPFGEFRVLDKRPGQRMTGGQGASGYNLAGIPWICYFNSTWVATHGCYWHNDYGRQHSNGCVNLTPQAAQWVFRWTTPMASYGAFRTLPDAEAGQPGTRVVVMW